MTRRKLKRKLADARAEIEILERRCESYEAKLDQIFEIVGPRWKVQTAPVSSLVVESWDLPNLPGGRPEGA